jgi:lysophospholipase L1-like esterase
MLRVLGNLAILLFTVLLCLLVAELVVRSLPSRRDTVVKKDGRTKVRFNPYRADGTFGYVIRPDWETFQVSDEYSVRVTTNALGMRGASAVAEKAPGVYRILVLGDSFTFGYGVEDWENFPARLETELAGPDRRIEVLNAGVPGWAADAYLLYLRESGLALEPDLVIVAISQNDLGDLAWNRLTLGADRLPIRIESTRRMIDQRGRMRYLHAGPLAAPDLDFPESDWLADHSELFNLLRFRIVRAWIAMQMESEEERRSRVAGEAPSGPIPSLSEAQIQRGLASGSAFRLRYHRYLVDAIRRDCAERGIALRFLVIASRVYPEQAHPDERILHEECQRDPLCLDTSDLFTGASAPETFYPEDGHWTAEGHARVARALASWLSADASLGIRPARKAWEAAR